LEVRKIMHKFWIITTCILTMHTSTLLCMKHTFSNRATEDLIYSLLVNSKNDVLDLYELYTTCKECDLLSLLTDGNLYKKLIVTIKHHGWYTVLKTYHGKSDVDFSHLTFLTQGDFGMPDRYGNTPLHVLALQPHNKTALAYALRHLQNKAAVNHQNLAGDTPLHWAWGANKELLRAFSGINTTITNHFGQKAIR